MEAAEVQNNDTVHPEVRAHINSLVSALGGFSVDDDDGYKLGDDALEVLRDLKRWIRFYDEKTNRMDVARCLADVNLVGGDLLHILATWKENCADGRFRARIALACLEIMVPLTWPIERDRETMTVNHHRHIPVLQLAQLAYKRGIVNFDGAHILHTAIRVALPSMALPIGDRTPRDQGIIRLVLYFLRNVAMIAPPPGVRYDDGDESQMISRSATIDAFSYQDVFLTLLAIASNMGEDFRTEDVVVMEIVFHIVKRVDPGRLFLNEQDFRRAKADELSSALKKEEAMLRSHGGRSAPTRHSRFGTMIWVRGQNGKLSTVSGQDALLDAAARERKMDSSKTFRPPRRPRKAAEMEPKDLGPPVSLNARAGQQLRSFVGDFLDSGFNPLFQHVIKSMNREAPHVLQYHRGQFFYLVAWFLEAERLRRRSKKDQKKQEQKTPAGDDDEVGSFNLVAGVLHQEMFITLNRALEQSYGDKDWSQLAAVMRAYSQILLTVQEMSESGNEEDEEIAGNILSRLFYEEATHDAVANIVRTYKDQGFEYLDACTELTHTYLRILEAYSKQNVDLQVRSRKRKRQKKKKAAAAATATATGEREDETVAPDDDESADDERHAEKTSQERKFDFKKFANRFIPQGVIDTFVTFTKYYRDLDDAQLKRAHRYFYRVAFKQQMSVMLFRLDIIHLFYNMIKGPEALTKESSMYREWEELAKQIIKKCIRKLEERPALFTELLFSKINSTAHYLEYGYEKQTLSTANPRPGAELEFKKAVDHDQQIAIVVGVLLDKNQTDHLAWIKTQLAAAESERRAWEAAQKAMLPSVESPDQPAEGEASNPLDATPPHITVRADNDARRTAMFKNPHLRLLMKLVGMERLTPTLDETPDSSWIFPGTLSPDALQNSIDLIIKAEFSPPTFEEGQSAEDQLRRKSAARKRVAYDDDNDGVHGMINDDDEDGLEEEDFLFAPGGPTARKPDERPKKRQKRLRRRKEGEEEVDDKELEERARARRQRELEKARKIKSEMYVHASDDETDEERDAEFFAKERMRQQAKDSTFGLTNKPASQKDKTDWDMLLDVNSDDEEMQEKEKEKGVEKKAKQKKRGRVNAFDSDSEEEEQADSESSAESESSTAKRKKTQKRRPQRKRRKGKIVHDDETSATVENDDNSGEEEAEDTPLSATPSNQMTAESSEKKTMHDITGKENQDPTQTEDQDEDEDNDMPAPTKARPRERTRARAGFVVDSSDDE